MYLTRLHPQVLQYSRGTVGSTTSLDFELGELLDICIGIGYSAPFYQHQRCWIPDYYLGSGISELSGMLEFTVIFIIKVGEPLLRPSTSIPTLPNEHLQRQLSGSP